MYLGTGCLSFGEPAVLYGNAFNIAAGQRPDRIVGRDHCGDEIFDFAAGFVVRPEPDADARLAADNEPARRWISELDFGAHLPQPIRYRRPPRLQIVVRIYDDAHHLPTWGLEFRSNCIAQTRIAFLVPDVERRFCSEVLSIKMFDDVFVIPAFHQENALP